MAQIGQLAHAHEVSDRLQGQPKSHVENGRTFPFIPLDMTTRCSLPTPGT